MPDTYLQLGLIDIKTNRPSEAVANLQHAVELQPTEATFQFACSTARSGGCWKVTTTPARAFAQTLAMEPSLSQGSKP